MVYPPALADYIGLIINLFTLFNQDPDNQRTKHGRPLKYTEESFIIFFCSMGKVLLIIGRTTLAGHIAKSISETHIATKTTEGVTLPPRYTAERWLAAVIHSSGAG